LKIKIFKILNNNAAIVKEECKREIIVIGKGISFGKKTGDILAKEKVEKTFILLEEENIIKFKEILKKTPIEHIIISEKIIKKAKNILDNDIYENIFISLTDHISFAVQRYNSGIFLKNTFLFDIKFFYPKEFEVGKIGIEIIKQSLGIIFTEDEAAFLALHFVNATLYKDINIEKIMNITKLIKDILYIVCDFFNVDFFSMENDMINKSAEKYYYIRFINHIRFFSSRVIEKVIIENDYNGELDFIKDKYHNSFACTLKISNFLIQNHNYVMSLEEMLYMTIHIQKIVKDRKQDKIKTDTNKTKLNGGKNMKEFTYTIKDPLGIHARPAGLLVKEAKLFDSDIKIEANGKSADAKKIFSIMGLGVETGQKITVKIDGTDEDVAFDSIKAFFEDNF